MPIMNETTIGLSVLTILLAALAYGLFGTSNEHSEASSKFRVLRVAHAGGGIEGKTYTNSLEALNANLKNGFRYFEIDFVFTKDDELVCLHDWQGSFEGLFGFRAKQRPTLKEFERLLEERRPEFTNCTLHGLANWMRDNPSAYLITDVKERNIEALTQIAQRIPDAAKRVIPQIYDPENYAQVKHIGFDQVIWTLYRYRGRRDALLDWVEQLDGPFAVTMPASRAESTLPMALRKLNIPTYAHTVNEIEEFRRHTGNGISEIYTDFLPPSK